MKVREAFCRRRAVAAIEIVKQIVNCDHVRARDALRDPEQVRNVQHVDALPLQRAMKLEVGGGRIIVVGAFKVREVLGKRPHIVNTAGHAEQEILVLVVQPAQGPHHVTNIGADTEVADTADVDRDLHNL